jgi:hypothetical protein
MKRTSLPLRIAVNLKTAKSLGLEPRAHNLVTEFFKAVAVAVSNYL